MTLAEQGRLDEAIGHYRQAIAIKPDFADGHANLGRLLRRKAENEEAMAEYEQALANDPNLADVHYLLGNILQEKGRLDDAIAHYEIAVELNPSDARFQGNLALLLATCPNGYSRNGSRAVVLAQQANRISGGDQPVFLGTLAAAYAECGRFPEAVETAQKALRAANGRRDTKMAAMIESDLKLYQAGVPLRLSNLPK